jgi:hypothetical protein
MEAPLTASSIHEAELGFSWVAQESKHRALRSGGRYRRLTIHTRPSACRSQLLQTHKSAHAVSGGELRDGAATPPAGTDGETARR